MPTDSDITWLFVEPQDVLLFRESRPFTAGESFWARSIFPPLSLPFLGALRSKIIVERGVSFDDYGRAVRGNSTSDEATTLHDQIGGFDDYGQLQAYGPFPARISTNDAPTLYFPTPANLAGEDTHGKSAAAEQPVRLTPQKEHDWSGLKTNPPHGASDSLYRWSADTPAGEPEHTLLPNKTLLSYLEGASSMSWGLDRSLLERERRVGIALDAGGTAKEGMLYTVEFIRMLEKDFTSADDEIHRAGFLIGLRGLGDLGLAGDETLQLLALGGERRIASYEAAEPGEASSNLLSGGEIVKKLEGNDRFLLYLATPAVFRSGWYPDFLDKENDLRHNLDDDVSFRLVAAATPKPMPLGGWDLGRGEPRTMYRAVPAGAVYVFETDDPLTQDQAQLLHDTYHFATLHENSNPDPGSTDPMHDHLKRLSQAGLGLTLLGASPIS